MPDAQNADTSSSRVPAATRVYASVSQIGMDWTILDVCAGANTQFIGVRNTQRLLELAQKSIGGLVMLKGRMLILLLAVRPAGGGGAPLQQQQLTVQASGYVVPAENLPAG